MTIRAAAKPRKRRKDAGVPKELTEAHKRKMQEARERKRREREKAEKVDLKATVRRLRDHVARATKEDDKTLAAFKRARSDKNFNAWMKANTVLLNTLTSLRAHEAKLEQEGNER